MGTPSEEAGLTKEGQTKADADKAVEEAEQALEAAKREQADVSTDPTSSGAGSTDSPTPTGQEGQSDTTDAPAPFDAPTVGELAEAANFLRRPNVDTADSSGFDKVAAYLDKVTEVRIAEGAEVASEPTAPESVAGAAEGQ